MMSITDWVAAGVCVEVDYNGIEALRNYHPVPFSLDRTDQFEVKTFTDSKKTIIMRPNTSWAGNSRKIILSLELTLRTSDGVEYLEDNGIGPRANIPLIGPDNLKLANWRIDKEVRDDGRTYFLDTLTWLPNTLIDHESFNALINSLPENGDHKTSLGALAAQGLNLQKLEPIKTTWTWIKGGVG